MPSRLPRILSFAGRDADPDRLVLRRSLIAAVALPALFAWGLRADNLTFASFGAFGCLATCGLFYFGGSFARQARAYVVFGAVCAVLVAAGTALSDSLPAAVVGMAVVGATVRFSGVFGERFAVAGNAVLLAFVLPVMVDAGPSSSYGPRIAGWSAGWAVAAAAVLVVVPDRSRRCLHLDAADVCRRLAVLLREGPPPGVARDEVLSRIVRDTHGLRERWASTPQHTVGPATSEQAFLLLLEHLGQLASFLKRDVAFGSSSYQLGVGLREAVASTLCGAAGLLEGHRDADVHLEVLSSSRAGYREVMRRRVDRVWEDPPAGLSPMDAASEAVGQVEEWFPMLLASRQALSVGANAALICHGRVPGQDFDVEPDVPEGGPSSAATFQRARTLVRAHLRWRDQAAQVAVRTGVVLALAVFAADALRAPLDLQHKFWVVLGALTVLRSSAVGTGATGVQAAAGTALGFVLSSGVVAVSGADPAWLWVVLFVSVFFAVYAPALVGFVVGQATFTLLVVVLFTILSPHGAAVGLQRIESVAAGAAVALVGGFALWPRGARALVGSSVAFTYRESARLLDAVAFAYTAGVSADVDGAVAGLADARWRADEAFTGLVAEQRTSGEVIVAWAKLSSVPATARTVADAVKSMSERGLPCAACDEAVAALGYELDRVEAILERVASRLTHPGDTVPASWGSKVPEARAALIRCLAAQVGRPPDERRSVLGMVLMLESLYMVDDVLGTVQEPLSLVTAVPHPQRPAGPVVRLRRR